MCFFYIVIVNIYEFGVFSVRQISLYLTRSVAILKIALGFVLLFCPFDLASGDICL